MYKFKQLLQESFNSPYKWKWVKEDNTQYQAKFKSAGDVIVVNFVAGRVGSWVLDFQIPKNENPHNNTNKFNAFNILSTVVLITKEFINTKNPFMILFSGNKEEGKDKLYKAMLKKFNKELADSGYQTTSWERNESIEFTIRKNFA